MRPRGERKIVAMADGGFDLLEAKTAVGVIRYGRDEVVAVVDHVNAGKTAADVVGAGNGIPVVPDVAAALAPAPGLRVVEVRAERRELREGHAQLRAAVQAVLAEVF